MYARLKWWWIKTYLNAAPLVLVLVYLFFWRGR